jgi:hypothetical protein
LLFTTTNDVVAVADPTGATTVTVTAWSGNATG